jgi:ubiquinone/menaquinone biosynthesis C-methylase UbiE
VIQANGVALPFRSGSFDLVNFTDILEHLHEPLVGLRELNRVLNKGGAVVLITPNRSSLPAMNPVHVNPLVLAERALSIRCNRVLPHRKILEQWMGVDFYHAEFSKKDIDALMKAAGLKVLRFETHLFYNGRLVKLVDGVFGKLPLLRFLCSSTTLVAKKRTAEGPPGCEPTIALRR